VEKDFKEMTSRALPILENLEYITARVKSITENIDDQVMVVRESISSVRQIADNIVAMERKVQDRIEGPILDAVSFVASVFNGVRTFFDRLRV
jgi:phage-related protein